MSLFDNLPIKLPLGKKAQEAEYFFALNIGLSKVSAAVWSMNGEKLEILGQHALPYSDTDDLLEKANQALDQALGRLPMEPDKILFGVPDGWLADENLKEPYLKLLQRMLKEYGLEALAYVSTSHALSHWLQKKEGAPVTAIIIGVDEYISASIIQGGKIIGSKVAKKTDQLFDSIAKAIGQFHDTEVLPSKILVYITDDSIKPEKMKENLLSYPWMQKLNFLHFPKIEVMPEGISISSVVFAGASEINPDVALQLESLPLASHGRVRQLEVQDPSESEDSGFVAGDIMSQKKEIDEAQDELQNISPLEEAEDLEDYALPKEMRQESARLPMAAAAHRSVTVEEELEPPAFYQGNISSSVGKFGPLIEKVKAMIVVPLSGIFGRVSIGGPGLGKLLIPVVLIGVVVAAFIFVLKAEVKVYVEPRILENSAEVTADPKVTAVNEELKIIPAELIETTVTGTGKGSASGQKQIGDPAKGQVILYNKTSGPKSFSAGTTLTGPSSLKFTLDSSVTIASMSAVEGGISFGKTAAAVTAVAIGPDSNLSAGTELSVAGADSSAVSAKVDQTLSGGTSKNVTVVTADDQKKLQAQVLDQLKVKAAEEVKSKLTDGKKLPPDALVVVENKSSFSKAVNDQASEFSLNSTVRFKGTAYSDLDLKTIVAKLVSTNVPEGYELNLTETESQANVSKVEKDGRLIFLAKFQAKLFPRLDKDELRKSIKGKSVADAVERLKRLEHVLGAEIILHPSLPSFASFMPILDKNISITVGPK